MRKAIAILILAFIVNSVCWGQGLSPDSAHGEDFFLVIGGGYSPSGNQASLEKNVIFFQRFLRDQKLAHRPFDIYFADGLSDRPSLQVRDVDTVPEANRLMAEFFGSQRNLGIQYRSHRVPDIQGMTSRSNINKWFATTGQRMKNGDRLFLYVTAHGGSSQDQDTPKDTTIYLWNNKRIKMSELVNHLDSLSGGVTIVTVMVQCHAGGFANLIFENGDPDNGVSPQNRCGFFATVHSRPAAGCTPEINEKDYEEYSTYFWAALGGESRTGQPIEPPDYDRNGQISFDEAHAYTVLESNTIDLPIKTSGEFLRTVSEFGDEQSAELLTDATRYSQVLALAKPADKAVLTGLSNQLKLSGEDRIVKARSEGSRRSRRRRGRTTQSRDSRTRTASVRSQSDQLRRSIAADLKKRWPDLANVLNPISIELLTDRADEFVAAVHSNDKYKRYLRLREKADGQLSSTEQRVKFERFVRTAENVILAANLEKSGTDADRQTYRRLVESESGGLGRK